MNGRNRERLRQTREALGWSQEEAAKLLGTTQSTINLWESGEEAPQPHFRQRLCELFEKTPQELDLVEEPLVPYPLIHRTIFDPLIPQLPRVPLVGREKDLEHLQQDLCVDMTEPIVILQGLPGVGKTTLACIVAQDPLIRTSFPDGVLWVGLGVRPDLQQSLVRWGTLLGLPPNELSTLRDEDRRAALRSLLETRRMLLVIDDAWSVEDALTFQIGGPHCATLITTRFPTLATILGGEPLILHELSIEDSLDLLHLLAPQIVESEMQKARTLAEAVGGLPLALTLTGNYLRVRTYGGQTRRIQTALEQVRSAKIRLHLSEPRSLIDRHPSLPVEPTLSLHSVIAVSDQNLHSEARSTLYTLSILPCKPASFSQEAALAIAACSLDALDALIEMGLMEKTDDGRYMQHQTIADYAQTHLASSQPHDRLLQFASTFTETHLMDYELLDQESSLILCALEAASTLEKQQEFISLTCAFVPFLLLRGNYALAQRYLLRTQQAALALKNSEGLVTAYLYLGDLAGKQGDYTQSQDFLEKGLDLARHLGNSEPISALLSLLGRSLWKQGNYPQAATFLQEGLLLARQIGQTQRMSELLATLGAVAASMGNYIQSETYLEEGLQLARQAEDRKQLCTLLMNLGATITELGRYEQACTYFEEGLTLARQIGHHERTSALLCNLGAVATLQGNYVQAETYQREGLSIARQIGHREWMAILLLNLGETAAVQGKYTQATFYFQETVKLAQQLNRPQLIARAFYEQVNLYLKQQEIDEAEVTLTKLLHIIPQNDLELQTLAQYGQARLFAAQGNIQKARQLGEASATVFENMGHHDAEQVRHWLASITTP
jgi:tetratricopeptide (TPR) repeat protein/transcriptional regulator with XRE-family HTH domain